MTNKNTDATPSRIREELRFLAMPTDFFTDKSECTKYTKAVYGPTNPAPETQRVSRVLRFASVTGLKPEMEKRYRELHASVWPELIARLRASNIRNYSIYISELDGVRYLFSYHEYVGTDHEADMAAITACPHTKRWWKETDPCQRPLENKQWVVPLEKVFQMD